MRGNDVIDLDLASRQSNWQRRGFLEKVFLPSEQELIRSHAEPSEVVWLLWSMKEAAYKAHQRRFSLHPWLNWKSLSCTFSRDTGSRASGKVSVHGHSYKTRSDILPDHIHTMADVCDLTEGTHVVQRTSSDTLKQELLELMGRRAGVSVEMLRLRKSVHGIPEITFQGSVYYTSFSLSDHGRFAAFSCR